MRALLAVALLATAPGCTNEREVALVAEIAKLREERVAKSVVEKAREETAAAEASLVEARANVETAREELAAREAERDALKRAFEAASAHNGELVAVIDDVARRAQETASRGQSLDAEIAKLRDAADHVGRQADLLAREIRPSDPAWATQRRVESLRDFLQRVAKDYPDDPVVTELATTALDPKAPASAAAAASLATRLRDRFAHVYELELPDVAKR